MLELKDVDAFYGRAHILHGVSLTVRPGEVVALLGRNGAGKTTTIKAAMGLVDVGRGSIRYGGAEIAGRAPYRIAQLGLGYVPEERRVFKGLTVLENLEVGRRVGRADGRAWDPQTLFELFPNLAERRHNLGGQLSGGEQQMLAIARTLMGAPRTILLDEPSEGVAPVIVQRMAETIEALKAEGLAVLLSEQNTRFAERVSDRAYIIETGRIRFEGPIEELSSNKDVQAAHLAL